MENGLWGGARLDSGRLIKSLSIECVVRGPAVFSHLVRKAESQATS